MNRSEIVIDPGHGDERTMGHSTPVGVRGPSGALEKDVTLRLAERVVEALGPLTTLTRRDDTNLSLAGRAQVARETGARVFISLHANSGRPGERGAEAWIHDRGSSASRSLASRVLAALAALPDAPPNRGVKTGPLAVLTPESLAPDTAACLLEVDFLSDPDGERRLVDDNALAGIAAAIAVALRDQLSVPPLPPPDPRRMAPSGAMAVAKRSGAVLGARRPAPGMLVAKPKALLRGSAASGTKRAALGGVADNRRAATDGPSHVTGPLARGDGLAHPPSQLNGYGQPHGRHELYDPE